MTPPRDPDTPSPQPGAESINSEDRLRMLMLRMLIESAVDYAIFTVDTGNRITSWNTGAERLLGWSESEVMGSHAELVFTPEDRASGQAENEFRIAAETGSAADERMHLRKDGSRFWATGTLRAMRSATGTIRGFVKIMRDNTERRQAQENLERELRVSHALREAAESANRAKDEFIATVSHELRTPLNTIRLWSKMLASGRLPHADWAEGVRVIERAAIAQQQLIDDLLDVSRMESGKLRLAVRPTRLVDAVKSAIEAVQPMLASRALRIEQTLSDDIGFVRADPERLQQVVWNLLANAIKFTPDGGSVRITAERVGADVRIRVVDTGVGIASHFLPHVFERFRQAEGVTTRTHSGLGLGLAIAKQLVELHGGWISAASDGEGRGAVFTVRLPLRKVSQRDEEFVEATHRHAGSLQGVTVLLVEDDDSTRDATRRLLEIDGAIVQVASTAAEARAAYVAQAPDLMVCDIGLPSEDGLTLIRRLRQFEHGANRRRVPALAVTAFARIEDQRHALAAGFDKHLPKPVDTDNLLAAMTELLSERREAGRTHRH